MSRRESRRWWRPAASNRPATRSRRRVRVVTEDDVAHGFELGYEIGAREERKRTDRRDEMLRRLADACEAADNGDPRPFDELMIEAGIRPPDDLTAVADAAGVTPLPDVDPAELVDDIEQWLREQG